LEYKGQSKGKTWTDPEGSRGLRRPAFMTICTWRWRGCQPYSPAAFTLQEMWNVENYFLLCNRPRRSRGGV